MYNVKVVTYDGEQDIYLYERPIGRYLKPVMTDDEKAEMREKRRTSVMTSDNMKRTRRRAIQTIYDYARANHWDLFVTWTFDPERVDRHDYDEVAAKMSNWLDNTRKNTCPDMKYLVVPERHKDGAYHFHGLMANVDVLPLKDSGVRDKKGRPIYNLSSYRMGFTTATKIEDSKRAANYITKYITDELICSTKNKRRYWVSRNLERGEIEYSMTENREMIKQAYESVAKRKKTVEVQKENFHQRIEIFTI